MSDTVRGNWCIVMSVDPPLVIVINIALGCQVVLDGWSMGGLHQIECIGSLTMMIIKFRIQRR